MKAVSCCECQHFIRNTAGVGDGIGQCAEYEAYKLKKPSDKALEKAFKALGGKCLYPKRLRYCSKFLVKA